MSEKLSYAQLLAANGELGKKMSGAPYKVSVLSNVMVNQFLEFLQYSLRRRAINVDVKFGNYDNIVMESATIGDANAVVVFWELANIVDGFQYKSETMDPELFESLLEKVRGEIDRVIESLQGVSLVIINKFSTLMFNHSFILQNRFDYAAERLNEHIESRKGPNILLADVDRVIAGVSVEKSFNPRFFYSSKAPYSIEFFREYSEYTAPVFLASTGRTKKALVFDCDNTLWKGIVGEDGASNIQMTAHSKDGAVFEEVQHLALGLGKKGVLLGLCSKNNFEDVQEIVAGKEFVLKDENLAVKKINWNDKAANLREMAAELNIGLDSMVFVDDSDFEAEYVREALPEVAVLQVPKEKYSYPGAFRDGMGLFFNRTITAEDLNKTEKYRQNAAREQAKNSHASLEDYLRSLEMKIKVHVNDEKIVPRMSQLTQKTNQFNLTTKRYTEGDILNFIRHGDRRLFAFEVADKFGDYGIVGLCIIQNQNGKSSVVVDSFLMSCRVLGRNVEYSFFGYLVNYLRNAGVTSLQAAYVKTPKNGQVANFYEQLEFDLSSASPDRKEYVKNISATSFKPVDYIEVVDDAVRA
ncbi:MAG: HAD-IIIC family phosphatase [Nitrospinae bacterium]|nr:HAD-IIIC family phosphatase [Nitrospinota bacterium]